MIGSEFSIIIQFKFDLEQYKSPSQFNSLYLVDDTKNREIMHKNKEKNQPNRNKRW